MGRREMLAKAVRRQQQKQKAPVIFVVPLYATPDGHEPTVMWLRDHRIPTEAELADAIVKAGFTREQATVAAAKALKQSNPEPGHEPAQHPEEK